VEATPVTPDLPDPPLRLTLVREVLAWEKVAPGGHHTCELHGLITARTPSKKTLFLHLHDGSGSIQVMAKQGSFSSEQWEALRALRTGERLLARGTLDYSSRHILTLVLESFSTVAISPTVEAPGDLDRALAEVGNQITLAHIRSRAVAHLYREEYLEVETHFISTSWRDTGLRPLHVDFPGFGRPIYLAPSPIPQLLRVLFLTGGPRVFSASRCFTSSYLDDLAGTERALLCAASIDMDEPALRAAGVRLLRHVLADKKALPEQFEYLQKDWLEEEVPWPQDPSTLRFDSPRVLHCSGVSLDSSEMFGHSVQLLRIYWPPNTCLLDIAVHPIGDMPSLGIMTLHLARLAQLVTHRTHRRSLNLEKRQ
jgi:hypothetical protein